MAHGIIEDGKPMFFIEVGHSHAVSKFLWANKVEDEKPDGSYPPLVPEAKKDEEERIFLPPLKNLRISKGRTGFGAFRAPSSRNKVAENGNYLKDENGDYVYEDVWESTTDVSNAFVNKIYHQARTIKV